MTYEYSEGLVAGILQEVDTWLSLRALYEEKINSISPKILEKYSEEQMRDLQQYAGEANYIRAATMLGFPKTVTRPQAIVGEKSKRSVYAMAKDYVQLLYNFDHRINRIIEVAQKKNRDLNPYYDYIRFLGQ